MQNMGVSTESFILDKIYFIDSNFKLFINEAHEKNRLSQRVNENGYRMVFDVLI